MSFLCSPRDGNLTLPGKPFSLYDILSPMRLRPQSCDFLLELALPLGPQACPRTASQILSHRDYHPWLFSRLNTPGSFTSSSFGRLDRLLITVSTMWIRHGCHHPSWCTEQNTSPGKRPLPFLIMLLDFHWYQPEIFWSLSTLLTQFKDRVSSPPWSFSWC